MIDLEDRLIKGGWVRPDELLKAKRDQIKRKKSIFCSLIKLGYISEDDVFRFFALNTNIPFVKPSDYKVNKDVIILVKEDFCRENLIIPLFKIELTLFTAMANPLDANLIIRICDSTKLEVEPLLACPSDIIKAIDDYFGLPDAFFSVENLSFKPQKLSRFPFYRASSRRHISIPIELTIKDGQLALSSNVSIPAVASDMSDDGKAMGVKTVIFIPKGARLTANLTQKNGGNNISINTEVIHCRMNKVNEFFIGLKVLDTDKNIISYLKRLAA